MRLIARGAINSATPSPRLNHPRPRAIPFAELFGGAVDRCRLFIDSIDSKVLEDIGPPLVSFMAGSARRSGRGLIRSHNWIPVVQPEKRKQAPVPPAAPGAPWGCFCRTA